VWSHDGIICTGETHKSVVTLTFAKGASLNDPTKLFNSSLKGNVRRAIDIHEADEIDADAFKALIKTGWQGKVKIWVVEQNWGMGRPAPSYGARLSA
jgi:hypothetical protein